MPHTLQVKHFYDLSLLGLTWLTMERDTDVRHGRSIPPVLRVLQQAGLLQDKQRLHALRDARLISYICGRVALCQTTPERDANEELEFQIGQGTKHLALRYFAHPYRMSKMLGDPAYKLIVTDAGLDYAESIESAYANLITGPEFMYSWNVVRTRVMRIMSIRNSRRMPEDFIPADTEEADV